MFSWHQIEIKSDGMFDLEYMWLYTFCNPDILNNVRGYGRLIFFKRINAFTEVQVKILTRKIIDIDPLFPSNFDLSLLALDMAQARRS